MVFSKFLFYFLLYPLSFVPLSILYLITDFLFLILYYLIGYRKKVVWSNLKRSFPEKSNSELKKIQREFYKHFTDLLAEGIKNLSISERELRRRIQVENPALMDDLYASGKSVLLVSGHYNNWEFIITAQALLFPHQAVGIGKPLTSKFWDKKLNELRARFGMRIINHTNVNTCLAEWKNERLAILTLSDQSPGDSKKSFWTTFLHQTTAVLFGAELLANQYDMAVVFFHLKKIKRGHYSISLELITDAPRKEEYGYITMTHTQKLEQLIKENPQYWLWSHKRWKREIPGNLEELKYEQRQKFEHTFRSTKSDSVI